MFVSDVLSFKQQIDKNGVIFCYSGIISQGIIEEIGDVVRTKVEMETSQNTMEKVFGIFVEQLTNVMRYSAEKRIHQDQTAGIGVIIVGREANKFYVTCGNLIEQDSKKRVLDYLDKIKQLDKNELKNLYKEQLHKKITPGTQGAGLGLLDMARKSSDPINYSMLDVDENYSFFSIKIFIEEYK